VVQLDAADASRLTTCVMKERIEMNESEQKRAGVIALSLCLGGLVLAIFIGILASALGHNANMPAYMIFLGFQVAGFILGEALGSALDIALRA